MSYAQHLTSVIVIGGGPAGLMVCHELAHAKIPFILLEKNERVGKKLLLTGNRRCNVTNTCSVDGFLDALTLKHKRFLIPSLRFFGPLDVVRFFKERGLELVCTDGFKYFPESNKSQSVLDVLLQPIPKHQIKVHHAVSAINKTTLGYEVMTKHGPFHAPHVVVATGSMAYPSTGSSGDGLYFADVFAIPYKPFTPAETVLYSEDIKNNYADLQGLSIEDAEVRFQDTKFSMKGSVLFTHFGLSGPAILHASEFIDQALREDKKTLFLRLTPHSETALTTLLNEARNKHAQLLAVLESLVPKRMAKKVLEALKIDNKKINELSQKQIYAIIRYLRAMPIQIDAVESRDKAIVNAGGILTQALDPHTMASKDHEGLYFIGETVDLHGPIGGFNLTIAFATGQCCAKAIVTHMKRDAH